MLVCLFPRWFGGGWAGMEKEGEMSEEIMYLFPSSGPLWSMSAEPGCVSRLWPTDITKPLQYEFAISDNTG